MLRKKIDGFTLLEVMIAMSILAIALTVLLGNQSQSLRLAEESSFTFTASLLMREKITELKASDEELFSSEGDFGDVHPGYFWSVEVNTPEFEDYPALLGADQFLQQVDVKIFTDGEQQMLTVRRLMLVADL